MEDIVIWFFGIILIMVKQPGAKRLIDWQTRFFNKQVSEIDPRSDLYCDAMRMVEELAFCQHRRRSRRNRYNIANIDEVYGQYYIHKSPVTLGNAWKVFYSEQYKVGDRI